MDTAPAQQIVWSIPPYGLVAVSERDAAAPRPRCGQLLIAATADWPGLRCGRLPSHDGVHSGFDDATIADIHSDHCLEHFTGS
jgi:hypothetical protein